MSYYIRNATMGCVLPLAFDSYAAAHIVCVDMQGEEWFHMYELAYFYEVIRITPWTRARAWALAHWHHPDWLSHVRSVIKATSWRIIGSLDTFALSWWITGHFKQGATIATAEVLTKIVWFYVHERLWRQIWKGHR